MTRKDEIMRKECYEEYSKFIDYINSHFNTMSIKEMMNLTGNLENAISYIAWRKNCIETFTSLNVGELEEINELPLEYLQTMIHELKTTQDAGLLNLETNEGVDELKRIVESYMIYLNEYDWNDESDDDWDDE